MNLKTKFKLIQTALIAMVLLSCGGKKDQVQFETSIDSLNLLKGERSKSQVFSFLQTCRATFSYEPFHLDY